MRVALISTVRNEEADLPAFLRSIEVQTRKPDLVVVTSGHCDDKTEDILQEYEDTHYEDGFVWLPLDGGNRSFGRNEAIRFAYEEGVEIVACTNVSVLDSAWLEHIVAPIEAGRAEVVGGGYRVDARTPREEAAALVTQYTQEEAERKEHVTALSMAFTVEAWRDVGGFPEELDTSEDTVFIQGLRGTGLRIEYEPLAVVTWRPATLTLRGAYRTYKQFARTDRKAGVKAAQYQYTLMVYMEAIVLAWMMTMPLFGYRLSPAGTILALLMLWIFVGWVAYRARKAISKGLFSGILFAVTVDVARIRGYYANSRRA